MFSRPTLTLSALALAATLGVSGTPAVGATTFTIETVDSAWCATPGRLLATPSGGLLLTTGALGCTHATMSPGSGTPYSGRVFERSTAG